MLGDISPALDKDVFASRVLERGQDGAFMMSVGATSVASDLDDDLVLFTSDTWLDTDIRLLLDDIHDGNLSDMDPADVESLFASSATAGRPKGVTAEFLSKIWRIDIPTAK